MKKSNCMNDNQIVRNCLQGDVEKYREIIDKYRGKVLALAINILGNREDAEDACQEAFLRAYNNLEKFNVQKSFSNWLYTILYNRCLDQLRKRYRFYNFFKKVKSSTFSEIETQPLNSLGDKKLDQNILKELSPKERTILFLWAYEGYTSNEISDVLKCSSSTARVHLFKARKKVKALLGEKKCLDAK